MASVKESGTPDPLLGFYGPDTLMWRINSEAVLLGAGPAALLLQIAHPLVAEGVARHSTFEQDPFRRLHGTIRTTMDLVFGDGPTAERAVRRLNGVHRGVRGDVGDPAARRLASTYRALDPELLLWVQVTLVMTSARAYRRWVAPLDDAELDRFWQEARVVGARLGIPLAASPPTWRDLHAYWESMVAPDGPIHVTPTARRLARLIVRPPIPYLPGPMIDLLALPGLDLLPGYLRDEFAVPWDHRRQEASRLAHVALRWWVGAVPRSWRQMPQARAAYRRALRRS